MILPYAKSKEHLLAGIPGLHLHDTHATGSIDAIVAGHMALGLKPRLPRPSDDKGVSFFKKLILDGRPYQQEGIAWMANTLSRYGGCILSDEMGLGKTFQTIHLLKQAMVGRALVICPGAVRETWRDELIKWGMNDLAVVYPNKKWNPTARVVVCSYHYDTIDRTVTEAFGSEYPEFMILDEAHRLRGRDAKRTKVLEEISPLVQFKVALTGTPQWSSMADWWQMLDIILPGKFGSKWDFDLRYAGATPGIHGGLDYPKVEDKPTAAQLAATRKRMHLDELEARLKFYMLGRLKRDVAKDLPPMTVSIRWVEATAEAKRATAKFHMNVGKATITDAILATLKGKVDEVLELAAEARRFVLTTWTNEGASQLHRLLNDRGVGCLLLTASMSGPKRAELVREAARDRKGIVATSDLLAEGLNLQSVASVGILHALDFSPSKMAQLFNRLHRIDIVASVQWHVVAMKESIDQYIIDVGTFRLDSIQAMMGQNKNKELGRALKDDRHDAKAERDALSRIYKAMEADDGVVQYEEGYED
jgi:superfamily II DNA or RNA helicase